MSSLNTSNASRSRQTPDRRYARNNDLKIAFTFIKKPSHIEIYGRALLHMCKMLCKILFFLLKINEYCYNYRSCDANDHKRKDRSIISSLNCSYRISLTGLLHSGQQSQKYCSDFQMWMPEQMYYSQKWMLYYLHYLRYRQMYCRYLWKLLLSPAESLSR